MKNDQKNLNGWVLRKKKIVQEQTDMFQQDYISSAVLHLEKALKQLELFNTDTNGSNRVVSKSFAQLSAIRDQLKSASQA